MLRNHIAQKAIEMAEKGDFSEVSSSGLQTFMVCSAIQVIDSVIIIKITLVKEHLHVKEFRLQRCTHPQLLLNFL